MSETCILALDVVAGLALGTLFFGGLWWTVRRTVAAGMAPIAIVGSRLARTVTALGGFYLIAQGHWQRLVACLLGFLLARIVVTRLAAVTDPTPRPSTRTTRNMNVSSDQQILWQHGFVKLNGTIVTTWAMMVVMVSAARLVTRRLATGATISRWQGALEIIVVGMNEQIGDVGLREPAKYLPFIGTLFLFVATASVCTVLPGYQPPTGSLSTTAALALCVFVAVPVFGILDQGVGGYLATYVKPTFIMLPFNVISELSRTLALAVRLFGNMMSGAMIIGILLTITPFVFPIVMTALGLLTGMVQAYIFSILAAVYIAAATTVRQPSPAIAPQAAGSR